MFFKIKAEYDNLYNPRTGHTIFANELLTDKELKEKGFDRKVVTPSHCPKKLTYWFFGSRFEMQEYKEATNV